MLEVAEYKGNLPCEVSSCVGIREHPGTVHSRSVPLVLKELFPDVRNPPIRSSAIHELEHCPRKFMYLYKWGLHSTGYTPALHIGSVFHLILQSLFMGVCRDRALEVAHNLLTRMSSEIYDSADVAGFTPSGQVVTAVVQTMEDDYHKARAMAVAFIDTIPFNWDDWEILNSPENLPCVELLLEAKVRGISAPIIAPCDLALVKKGTTDVWIVDHKTTSMKTMARARSVRISPQIALYRLVLQCHLDAWVEKHPDYPHYKVVGSIHNIIKKPTIKFCPKTKDRAGFDSYLSRVAQWYRDEQEKDPNDSPILQTATAFTAPVLGRGLYLRLQQQARASRTYPNLDRFYQAGDYACLSFNSECPFSGLCTSAVELWEDEVKRRFIIKFREDDEEENNHGE